ncbi:MAG TPA: hypothetical protein VM580_16540, partial [Labilithrix sp.]|nr:hypothetical protein [Labilithrix sp.]
MARRGAWRWIWVLVTSVAFLSLGARVARAEPTAFDAALQEMAQPTSDSVASAVRSLEASGDPRALGVL